MPSVRTSHDDSAVLYSVVVPTYKECGNLEELTLRLFRALGDAGMDHTAELLIVDDNSQDGSAELVHSLATKGYNVQIITRTEERGLSSAVLRGFAETSSSSRYFVCMDADLQHPPESIPNILRMLESSYPFVLGTRYGQGTNVSDDWPLHRRIISAGARMLARPLTDMSDPMSGLFGVRRALLEEHLHFDGTCASKGVLRPESSINPIGFKIALEIYIKCHVIMHGEVPISFGIRQAGESKLSGKVILNYLDHLFALYMAAKPAMLVVVALCAFLFVLLLLELIGSV